MRVVSGPRIQDVARRAGVAIGTVSNVLNKPQMVSEPTRARVEAAIAELGFVRNSAARALAARRTDTVGLVMIDMGNSLFVDIARGAEAATTRSQLKLLLANSDVDREKQAEYLELFDEARVAGILLAPLDGSLDAAYTVQRHGRPVVLVNAPAAAPGLCSVMVDEELGGFLAADHLLAQGSRRLVYLAAHLGLHPIQGRLAGARRAATQAQASLELVEAPSLDITSGREVGRHLLESRTVDGVVCASDPLAVGVIEAATDLGIGVPEQLLVVGYDDNHFASEGAVPVSTVSQPGQRMGELAVELLIEDLEQGRRHQHRNVTLEPRLIVRRSSARSNRTRPDRGGDGSGV